MFNSLRDQLDPTISAISTCLIFVSISALVTVYIFNRNQKNKEQL
jgi:putative spermidine/putrescine transport system permease protein